MSGRDKKKNKTKKRVIIFGILGILCMIFIIGCNLRRPAVADAITSGHPAVITASV
ncbi:MAG: hypothetical protein PHY47_24745 [Lachnospiraceae bacterium]|nr:hypothetical protein [Lachnospiraceae bacterium]